MNNDKLKHIVDELFLQFAQNYPQAQHGEYLSAQTNLILAFNEYSQDKQFVAENPELKSLSKPENERLRQIIAWKTEQYLTAILTCANDNVNKL